jgi:thiamine biosynthesis lipoprotein
VRSIPIMGTIVTIDVLPRDVPIDDRGESRRAAVDRAFDWFREIERICNRFDPDSELRRLTRQPPTPVHVSGILFALVEFAIAVASDTGGAFDPTVGARMEANGFTRDYRTGAPANSGVAPDPRVTFRDVHLDAASRSITIVRPLLLDLGAVAKGLATDLAARELQPLSHFAIDAGGDLFVAGLNPDGHPWTIGIRHPRRDREFIESLTVSDAAVCTSGDYERETAGRHHILDPRNGGTAIASASATVIASTAMVADAFATAAFVLGPRDGVAFLERHGVAGVIYSSNLERFATAGFPGQHATVLSNA